MRRSSKAIGQCRTIRQLTVVFGHNLIPSSYSLCWLVEKDILNAINKLLGNISLIWGRCTHRTSNTGSSEWLDLWRLNQVVYGGGYNLSKPLTTNL